MKCDNCGKREATVRYSENINGRRRELHLCEQCSQELGIDRMDFNMPIDFSSFFSGMLEEFEGSDFMPMFDTVKDLQCKNCGYTFEDILNTGKFGCANCYDTFESRIEPIIRKMQGSSQHVGRLGKVTEHKLNTKPNVKKKIQKQDSQKNEIEQLKEKLKKAVQEEKYEEAAKLRDEINAKENKNK